MNKFFCTKSVFYMIYVSNDNGDFEMKTVKELKQCKNKLQQSGKKCKTSASFLSKVVKVN